MAKKMIGVEFGSSTLKMVSYIGDKIQTMAVKHLPEDLVREGKITSPETMSTFLKEMRKENGIPAGPCALVLPGQVVISHHVLMPVMSDQEVMLNLPYEFREYVGTDGTLYDYDYSVLSVKDNTMELYAAAVRKELVEGYRDILKKAGLRLKIAIPMEMAWMNLVDQAPQAPGKLCIVDAGHDFTRVHIFSHGNFSMGKDIEMGGALLDQAIAEAQKVDPHVARTHKEADMDGVLNEDYCVDVYQTLAIDVMKTVNFYSYSNSADGEDRLNDLYYCGGSSVIEPLRSAMGRATDMPMHAVSQLLGQEVDETLALSCAVAVGAAIQKL